MARRAGFWIRTFAALLDGVVFIVLGVVSGMALDAVWQKTLDAQRASAAAGMVLYGGWALYTLSEIIFAGTPGKLLLGLRIVSVDGSPADNWRRFHRWQTKQLPAICAALFALTVYGPFMLLGGFMNTIVLIGCFAALNDDHLTWHDQWAGTAVCHRRKTLAVPRPQTAAASTNPPSLT